MQNKFTCKNQYGYTIKDLYIDYENKTFKTGNLFYGDATKVSKRYMDNMIETMKKAGLKEIK